VAGTGHSDERRVDVMKLLGGCFAVATGVLALAGPAAAQENLDAGKSPAQLYASDCAICHKTPQGLAAKGGGVLGLESYLREHYTASKESAAAIANYLRGVGGGPAAPAAARTGPKRPPKGDAKGDEKPKAGEAEKPTEKMGEKPADQKPAAGKPSEPKPSEPKSGDAKSGEPKSGEPKSGGGKSGGGKSGAASAPKPADAKPEGGKSD